MNLLRKLLWPISPLYAAVVWFRNYCYDRGWFPSEQFQVPVLCIGNLSVGGTGKTPMVEWVLRHLEGRDVAVLSRGYRRKTTGFQIAGPDSSADSVGDEPAQLAARFPGVVVAVDADRRRGIRKLIDQVNPELIILDDGFQHRKVQPAAAILLTARDALYSESGYLPSGDLRDHRSQARRANLIVVTKCPELPAEAERVAVRKRLGPEPGQDLLYAILAYGDPVDARGNAVTWEHIAAAPFVLVTGIARPGPLVAYLQSKGLGFKHLEFPDHHRFSPGELDTLRGCNRLLTTEKDAMRLRPHLDNYWTIGVRHHFGDGDRQVLAGFLEGLL